MVTGQLEIVLGGWVMSDAAVTYYNDLIDQHTLGFDFLQQTLGPCAQSRVAWHVDQFGHSREHAALFTKVSSLSPCRRSRDRPDMSRPTHPATQHPALFCSTHQRQPK